MSDQPQQLTILDLGRMVKAKHGEYGDMSDEEVGRRVQAKYPKEYGDFKPVSAPESDNGPGLQRLLNNFHVNADPSKYLELAGHLLAAPVTGILKSPGEIYDWAARGFHNPPSGGFAGEEPITQAMGNALMALTPAIPEAAADAGAAIKGGVGAIKPGVTLSKSGVRPTLGLSGVPEAARMAVDLRRAAASRASNPAAMDPGVTVTPGPPAVPVDPNLPDPGVKVIPGPSGPSPVPAATAPVGVQAYEVGNLTPKQFSKLSPESQAQLQRVADALNRSKTVAPTAPVQAAPIGRVDVGPPSPGGPSAVESARIQIQQEAAQKAAARQQQAQPAPAQPVPVPAPTPEVAQQPPVAQAAPAAPSVAQQFRDAVVPPGTPINEAGVATIPAKTPEGNPKVPVETEAYKGRARLTRADKSDSLAQYMAARFDDIGKTTPKDWQNATSQLQMDWPKTQPAIEKLVLETKQAFDKLKAGPMSNPQARAAAEALQAAMDEGKSPTPEAPVSQPTAPAAKTPRTPKKAAPAAAAPRDPTPEAQAQFDERLNSAMLGRDAMKKAADSGFSDDASQRIAEMATRRGLLSEQDVTGILKMAKTINEMDGGPPHARQLAEAIQYRSPEILQQIANGNELTDWYDTSSIQPIPDRIDTKGGLVEKGGANHPIAKRAQSILERMRGNSK